MESQPSIIIASSPCEPKKKTLTRQELTKKIKNSLGAAFKRGMLRGDSIVSSILSPAS